jgi:hypothetical protein
MRPGEFGPPLWKEKFSERTLTGEIGILMHVALDPTSSRTIHVHITNAGLSYIGRLIFDNPRFCHHISVLLKSQVGRTMEEIGDLEL